MSERALAKAYKDNMDNRRIVRRCNLLILMRLSNYNGNEIILDFLLRNKKVQGQFIVIKIFHQITRGPEPNGGDISQYVRKITSLAKIGAHRVCLVVYLITYSYWHHNELTAKRLHYYINVHNNWRQHNGDQTFSFHSRSNFISVLQSRHRTLNSNIFFCIGLVSLHFNTFQDGDCL